MEPFIDESHQHIFAENEEFHVNNANTDNVTIIETPFSDVDDKTKGSGKGFALGSISEKIVPWLQSRYEMKEGGKTAIQEIITLYNHDFPRDCVYFPLESFQVGQLVRQAFPEIALCKVTCKESKKRYRCYKGLTRREADCGPAPIFPYELPKVQKRKSKPASQNSPNVIYMQVTALQDARSETPPGIRGQIATCKIKLPQSTRPSSSRPFPQLRVQPPKPDQLNLLSSASTSPNSSMHSPLIESAPTGQGQHNPYFVPFIKPHSEQKEKERG
ncbi:unnamed protein product [Oikopleura dioica]|uniref:RFX-type winged-helix domain-containing protein n=1 Tax=Oikopleura dioica TaxID=34765 RepID=E4YVZ8_OIKDI|nr:unnamed protein product [Oikopleura dioica]